MLYKGFWFKLVIVNFFLFCVKVFLIFIKFVFVNIIR